MSTDGRELWADEPIFICKPDGSEFTEHRTVKGTPTATVCGITYESLPANDGDPTDKNWFSDHDRDDVVPCKEGCL